MKYLTLSILSLLLFSCINEDELYELFPVYDFHGNSAKVWIVNQSSNNDIPELEAYRNCFIFYSNNTFKEQALIHLGSNEGFIGTYTIHTKHGITYLTLNYSQKDKKSKQYIIKDLSNQRLQIIEMDDKKRTFTFISLPPPLP